MGFLGYYALALTVVVVVQNFGKLAAAALYVAGLFGYKPPAK